MRVAAAVSLACGPSGPTSLTVDQFAAFDVTLRRRVIADLAKAPPPSTLALLRAAGGDGDSGVRASAALGLGNLSGDAALATIKALQKDSDPSVHNAANAAEIQFKAARELARLLAKWDALCKSEGRAARADKALAEMLRKTFIKDKPAASSVAGMSGLTNSKAQSAAIVWR